MFTTIANLFETKKTVKIAWIVLLVMFLCSMVTYRLYDKPGLYVADEFGFIAPAAYLCGFDWSEQISNIGYYGIGYGLLLLPGFYFCKTAHQITHYISTVNISLFACVIILSFRLLRNLFPKANFIKISICTIITSLYISNICFLQSGWSETLNLVLYWLILNLLFDVVKKGKWIHILLLAIVLCYAMIVHMRNITIVFACSITLLIWQIKRKKISTKRVLAFSVFVIIGIIIFYTSKEFIQQHLYRTTSGQEQSNDVAFMVNAGKNQIVEFGFLQVIKNFMVSMAGKIFYIISTTYGLIVFGILGIYSFVKKSENNENRSVLVCSILMFIFSLFLCSYSMMNPARLDNIFYGRYVESAIGLLLSVGFLYLSSINVRQIVMVDAILLFVYKVVILFTDKKYSELLADESIQGFVFQCSTGIAKFFLSGEVHIIITKVCEQTLIILAIYGIISILISYCNQHPHQYIKRYLQTILLGLITIILSTVWIRDSGVVIDGILSYQNGYYREGKLVLDNQNNESILDYIPICWDESDNYEIYYYADCKWNERLLVLQYEIGKTPILNINTLDNLNEESAIYVLLDTNDDYGLKQTELEGKNFHYCCSTKNFILYAKEI